jgi:hypothetical protein
LVLRWSVGHFEFAAHLGDRRTHAGVSSAFVCGRLSTDAGRGSGPGLGADRRVVNLRALGEARGREGAIPLHPDGEGRCRSGLGLVFQPQAPLEQRPGLTEKPELNVGGIQIGSQPTGRFAGGAFVSKDGLAVLFQLPTVRKTTFFFLTSVFCSWKLNCVVVDWGWPCFFCTCLLCFFCTCLFGSFVFAPAQLGNSNSQLGNSNSSKKATLQLRSFLATATFFFSLSVNYLIGTISQKCGLPSFCKLFD